MNAQTFVLASAAYLVAAVLFILSLKGLGSQATARRGNVYGIIGMRFRKPRHTRLCWAQSAAAACWVPSWLHASA
jgi:NAD/NADP transhydrogenase beta subunit